MPLESVQGGSDGGTWSYGYDAAGRLANATDPANITTTYGYDWMANRTAVTAGTDPTVTTTYDDSGLPLSSDGTTFTHDPVGNLTSVERASGADWSYGYDSWSRMTTATKSGLVVGDEVALSYDALGRTVSKRAGLKTTTYDYVGTGEEIAVATVATALGSTATSYAHGPAGPLAEDAGAGVRFYLSDPHGDIVGLADPSGAAVGTRTFSPWGETRQSSGESSALGFQGDPLDADTGLYDLGTRFYDPGLGRFSTRDVLFGDPMAPVSLNQFVYAAGDPVSNIDLDGLCAQPDVCGPTHETRKGRRKQAKIGRAAVREQSKSASYNANSKIIQSYRPEEPMPDDPPVSPKAASIIPKIDFWNSRAFQAAAKATWEAAGRFAPEHLVWRDGRPAVHWNNHDSRIEWSDKANKWHFDDAGTGKHHAPVGEGVKAAARRAGQLTGRAARRGVVAAYAAMRVLGALAGEVFIIPPVPGDHICRTTDVCKPPPIA